MNYKLKDSYIKAKSLDKMKAILIIKEKRQGEKRQTRKQIKVRSSL